MGGALLKSLRWIFLILVLPAACLPDAAWEGVEVSEADGTGNMACTDPWFVHCDNDSLVYRGAWPDHASGTVKSTNYESTLSCTVILTGPTGGIFDAYTGHVRVEWGDPTLVDEVPVIWGNLKSVFR